MSKLSNWLVIFIVAAACTCGARTECGAKAQLSLLTGIHDDGLCRRVSNRGVLLYEASQLLIEEYNSKTTGFKLEISVLDTCGSITGALKAAMKALVSADVSCLQPPHYLGIIGPDNPTNAEAVQKVTSVLRVPHLVRKPSTSTFLHHLAMENNSYIVQGILKVIEQLKWKTFTLVAPPDDDGNDDVQNIAKKLTIESIQRNLCVIVYDSEEGEFTKNVIHVGKPDDSFFSGLVNSTIIIASEGKLENELKRVNSSNTIILLEDDRNEPNELQVRVEMSKWWNNADIVGKFDHEELREVRWLRDAIKSYGTALDSICKKKKCKSQIDGADWNEMISKILSLRNSKLADEIIELNILLKIKNGDMESVGKIMVKNNDAKISWDVDEEKKKDGKKNDDREKRNKKEKDKSGEEKENDDEKDAEDNDDEEDEDEDEDDGKNVKEKNKEEDEDDLPKEINKLIAKSKIEPAGTGCAFDLHEAKLTKDDEDHSTHILVSEMDDTEWWTMVGTVSGVGVAMFVVGILAVYVVYTNIRGPRSPKGQSSSGRRYSIDNENSLRRVGSDREMPSSGGRGGGGRGQNQRQQRQQNNSTHRRDSIRSNISDRSV